VIPRGLRALAAVPGVLGGGGVGVPVRGPSGLGAGHGYKQERLAAEVALLEAPVLGVIAALWILVGVRAVAWPWNRLLIK
jgi:hypothetical protein